MSLTTVPGDGCHSLTHSPLPVPAYLRYFLTSHDYLPIYMSSKPWLRCCTLSVTHTCTNTYTNTQWVAGLVTTPPTVAITSATSHHCAWARTWAASRSLLCHVQCPTPSFTVSTKPTPGSEHGSTITKDSSVRICTTWARFFSRQLKGAYLRTYLPYSTFSPPMRPCGFPLLSLSGCL